MPSEFSTITPKPLDPTVIGGDSLASQLRLYLDTNLARSLIVEATSGKYIFQVMKHFWNFSKVYILLQITCLNRRGAAFILTSMTPLQKPRFISSRYGSYYL